MDDDLPIHDPLAGINDYACNDFAPDSLGDDSNVCTTCFYHKEDHQMSNDFTFEDAMALRDFPKANKPKLRLSGQDGNAFFIIGRGMAALRKAGYSKEDIDKFEEEATSGDYDNVLVTAMRWFDVS